MVCGILFGDMPLEDTVQLFWDIIIYKFRGQELLKYF